MQRVIRKLLGFKPVWLVVRQLRKIWVRTVSFAILALVSVALAQFIGQMLPLQWSDRIGAGAVDQVLNILATSMLAVTTFSLSIAVSAFARAAASATPRATALLQEDETTQNVLATFLGAFLFSLVGIVALKAGYYSEAGRLVLFATTVLVIAFVVVALLRWISHLTDFGRIEDTLERVEVVATKAIEARVAEPWLGGKPQDAPPPDGARRICADTVGFVQHIDMAAVSKCAEQLGGEVWIAALPGSFVHPAAPLLYFAGAEIDDDAQLKPLRAAFTCGQSRSFDQDPVFGMIVMSEIASRALSPGVNDPGSAMDVIGRLVRILCHWDSNVDHDVEFPNITVPSLKVDDLLRHAFQPIARDGAATIEVQTSLQEALAALVQCDPETFTSAAREVSRDAVTRAEKAMALTGEIEHIKDIAARI
ncbi:MAG: DUF2254 domain-containing protein [Yoonia sp.]|uniref:DUF2254 domain-containing protein n=1 Tax=Yoonia sp. TaxID=2212373 RepID=UPI003EF9BBEE